MVETKSSEAERLTMTVAQASEALNISKATGYMLVSTGRLPAIRISPRRIVIPIASLTRMLESTEEEEV